MWSLSTSHCRYATCLRLTVIKLCASTSPCRLPSCAHVDRPCPVWPDSFLHAPKTRVASHVRGHDMRHLGAAVLIWSPGNRVALGVIGRAGELDHFTTVPAICAIFGLVRAFSRMGLLFHPWIGCLSDECFLAHGLFHVWVCSFTHGLRYDIPCHTYSGFLI